MTDVSPGYPRVLIAAFQGWSDAGDATTEVLHHLGALVDAEVLHVIGSEGYVDYQVHRPKISLDDSGERILEWPDTRLYGSIRRPGADDPAEADGETVRRIDGGRVTELFLLSGVEPARDWQSFADEIVELVDVWAIDNVIILGAMFSDAPHSRPVVTTVTSEDAGRREATGATRSTYEGPAGIATVVDLALTEAGIAPVSLWAQVPHYVHSTPSPKVTLALLDKLEELLDIVIPRGELLDQATDWEANINRIAAADEDMSRYIRGLEETRDEALAAETTGDAIAAEFEKFLEGGDRAGGEGGSGGAGSGSGSEAGTASADSADRAAAGPGNSAADSEDSAADPADSAESNAGDSGDAPGDAAGRGEGDDPEAGETPPAR
ncbi:PAC2 family protein [Leucobacter luti]|uniref:PAC2 family protein n=1 Tax=Leucobacter luti TaxID=340320 RepID=A0A4Q7TM15_9MICO|nr:PAC2 family protein [Leucobacter luti]MBL3700230.1 PAC2 family protein [Leucobacter luti]RZT61047.1 PAC2 family protein [Leucobacter luti]